MGEEESGGKGSSPVQRNLSSLVKELFSRLFKGEACTQRGARRELWRAGQLLCSKRSLTTRGGRGLWGDCSQCAERMSDNAEEGQRLNLNNREGKKASLRGRKMGSIQEGQSRKRVPQQERILRGRYRIARIPIEKPREEKKIDLVTKGKRLTESQVEGKDAREGPSTKRGQEHTQNLKKGERNL